MTRKITFCALVFVLSTFLLTSCGEGEQVQENSWQEQYDLGVRYLSKSNYEEAIIAFTAAIGIDPVRSASMLR